MKKLLSILGAVTLAASSTATVVACGDKEKPEEEVVEEFDYEKTLKQYLSDVKGAIDNNMTKAFKNYGFIGDDSLPDNLKLEDLKKAIEEGQLADDKSDIHKLFVKFITGIIPTAEINRDIQTILNNVNYNQVIVDKSSPLKEGFIVQKLEGKIKGDNVSVFAEIYTSIAYKDETGQTQSDNHLINVEISVFKKEEDIVLADKLAAIYEKAFKETNANKFKFESDKGDLDESSKSINTNEKLNSQIQAIFKDIESEYAIADPYGQLKLDYSGSTISADPSQLVAASRTSGPTETLYNVDVHNQNDNMKDLAMALGDENGGIYETEYINKVVKGDKGQYILNRYLTNEDYYKEMMEVIENKSSVAKTINQYHLNYNYQSSSLKKTLDSQNSKFEINLEKGSRLIALFGAKIKGMKFSLGAHTYNLQNVSVAVQQETTHLSTEKLYETFIADAFRYQKALSNVKTTHSEAGVKPVYDKFEFNSELKKEDFANTRVLNSDVFEEAIFYSNEEANKYAETYGMYSKLLNKQSVSNKILINANGYIFPLDNSGWTLQPHINRVVTYFYSSDVVDFAGSTFGFTIGSRYTDADYEAGKTKSSYYPISSDPLKLSTNVLKDATCSGFKVIFK